MADSGAIPRGKKPSKDDQKLSTPRAAARGGAKRRQRAGQNAPRVWARVPVSPTTPGKGRLVRLEPEDGPGPASAPPSPGESDPESSAAPPCPVNCIFSGLSKFGSLPPVVPVAPSPPRPGALAPWRDGPKKIQCKLQHTLVLELDKILLYSTLLTHGQQDAMATFTIDFQGTPYEVYVKLRPHVQEFLESLSKTYEIFIYTTAKKDYANKLLEVLDPRKKLIRHCLSQSDCVSYQGCYWKDLTRLGRDLAKTVALDHTMQGFPAQAGNWISVPPWSGDPEDEELLCLIPALSELGQEEDVHPKIQQQFQPPKEG